MTDTLEKCIERYLFWQHSSERKAEMIRQYTILTFKLSGKQFEAKVWQFEKQKAKEGELSEEEKQLISNETNFEEMPSV